MPSSTVKKLLFAAFACLAIAAVAAGCGGSSSSSGGGPTIALMLPENETPRYETDDRPDFEKAVEEKCSECEVKYFNAGGDAEKQQSQAEAALTQGAEVLVVDPMDSKSAATIAEKAQAQSVPVVSYDRLIENGEINAYISFDNKKVGELQSETLAKKLKEDGHASGPIIMINGDPADPNAALFKEGAHVGFEAAGVEIAKEYDTPGWSAENAQREAQQAITAIGETGFAGIYAANDDTAGGAIAAMKGVGINPEDVPVTGQDSTVAGLQRILTGEQFMTIFKPIVPEAEIAAEMAISLGETGEVETKEKTEDINNGKAEVPSVLLTSTPVTKEKFVAPAVLCEGAFAAACKEAGISG